MSDDVIGTPPCEHCGARADFGETHDRGCGAAPGLWRHRAWRVCTDATPTAPARYAGIAEGTWQAAHARDALDVVIAVWRHVAATTGAQLGAIRAPEGS